jgi:hypothetical protein
VGCCRALEMEAHGARICEHRLGRRAATGPLLLRGLA